MDMQSNLRGYFARRWFLHNGEQFDRLIRLISVALSVSESVAATLLREAHVYTAVDTLSDAEKQLGLPSGDHLPIDERRRRIIARNYERGGPTSTKDFEAALSMLANAKATVIPLYSDFAVVYKLEVGTAKLNLPILEEYIRKNKLAHLEHSYSLSETQSNLEFNSTQYPIVHISTYQACGTFSSGGEYEL
ncbi:DUF2313 domain-containing protein [Brevibacillus sp. AG]|uniref:putative phage tail protein n=1 Tax=Brevibacillus sp. AG TaxID=3020891 RepID=UPI00232D3123|nr:putative phage tail protein [Brevibacillus sp. AG]MDC0763489.1 DUF2313 domain-containing protein [Brevibacillus sp. AG]